MLTNYTIDDFENIKYQGFGQLKFLADTLSNLFEKFGYCQIEIPTFENFEFYSSDKALKTEDLFKLVDSSGKVLVLKPDATLPITRIAAINHHDPDEIIKLSYFTNIYKDFSSHKEISKKELTQVGIEYFGNDSPNCEAEVIALAILALKIFGIKNIHIDIGNVTFIEALLNETFLNNKEKDILIDYIENKNIGDIETFIKHDSRIPEKYKPIILKLPRLYGKPEEVFKEMENLVVNRKMESTLNRLKQVYDYCCSLGLKDYINVDIGFTNRMNYYSGLIFKAYLDEVGEPIISGGRYDNLSKRFGIDRPACGFSLDIVPLLDYLDSNDLFPKEENSKIILVYEPEYREKAFEICNSYRRNNQSAEMFMIDQDTNHTVEHILKNPHYQNSQIFMLGNDGLVEWKN